MTDAQWLTVVAAFGSMVTGLIIGTLSIVIGILNLLKKK